MRIYLLIGVAVVLTLSALAVSAIESKKGANVVCSRGLPQCLLRWRVESVLRSFCADRMKWTWVITSESEWQSLTKKLQRRTETAFSVLPAERTWLRESAFPLGEPKRLQSVIAHELAHIRLNTEDENLADEEAFIILSRGSKCGG